MAQASHLAMRDESCNAPPSHATRRVFFARTRSPIRTMTQDRAEVIRDRASKFMQHVDYLSGELGGCDVSKRQKAPTSY